MRRIISTMLVVMMMVGAFRPLAISAAEGAESDIPFMELNQSYEITMTEDDTVYYNFTPDADGKYKFESAGDYDVYASLLDENGEEIEENDDGGSYMNFKLSAFLEAGRTYSLEIRSYSEEAEFSISVAEKIPVTLDTILRLDYQKYYYGYVGDSVMLHVNAQSKMGELTYTWYDSDDEIISGETTDSCTITISNDTNYSCEISDGINTRWATFYIELGTEGEKRVESISMTNSEQKRFYILGSCSSFSGSIKVNYEDGTFENISYYECKTWDNIEEDDDGDRIAGDYIQYIYYKGAVTSYGITVVDTSLITELTLENELTDQIAAGTSEYRFYKFMPSENENYAFKFSEVKGMGQYEMFGIYYGETQKQNFSQDIMITNSFRKDSPCVLVVNSANEESLSYKVKITKEIWEPIELEKNILFYGSTTYYCQYMPERNGCYKLDRLVSTAGGYPSVVLYDENKQRITTMYENEGIYLQADKMYYIEIKDWSRQGAGMVLKAVKYVDYPDSTVAAGVSNDKMSWSLDDAGTLSVQSEDGKMPSRPWYTYAAEIKNVELGEEIVEIGDVAFYDCINLMKINLTSKIEKIGYSAFYNCDLLTKVEITPGLTKIGDHAFFGCDNIQEIVFTGKNNLSYVGSNAFNGTAWAKQQGNAVMLDNILLQYQGEETNVIVPQNVAYIGNNAMQNLTMESVTLHSSLKGIWSNGLANCKNLKKVTVPGTVMELAYRAFAQCTALESLVLENGVKSLGEASFYGCTNLKNITIPGSVTDIAYKTFADCTVLETVVIEEGVESLGEAAFLGSNKLKNITIPSSVTKIEKNAIGYEWDKTAWKPIKSQNLPVIHCQLNSVAYQYAIENGIPYVILGAGNNSSTIALIGTKIDASQIEGAGGVVPPTSTFTVTSNDPKNPTVAFDGVADENAKPVSIPEYIIYKGVTYKVTSVSIKDFIKTGSAAKYGVTDNSISNLTVEYIGTTNKKKKSVSVPQYATYKGVKFKVKSVKAKSFRNNKKLTNVKIASGITKIGKNAFLGCVNLKTVTIGKSLVSIGENAFKNCNKLEKISIKSSKLKSVGKNALKGVNVKCKIKVPKKKIKKYQKLFKNKGQKITVRR